MAGINRERLERKYLGAQRLQEASASLPGGMARFQLIEGKLVPFSARTRWSILGRYLEVEFGFQGDDRKFRLRTRRGAPLHAGSLPIEAVCAYWPRLLGRERPFYEVSEVVERDTDRRYAVSPAAQFGPLVLIAAIVVAAVTMGLVKRAAG